MLNLIQSLVVTFIKVIVSVVVFCKGPIVVGLIIGASILSFANKAEAAIVQGTQQEVVQAEKDVAKGIYINDNGDRVRKPTTDICNMYRNTYLSYSNKYGPAKGARIWLVIVTRRGC